MARARPSSECPFSPARVLFWAAWLACAPAPAETSTTLTGAVRGDYFQSTKNLDDTRDLVGATVQLKGVVRREDTTFRFEGRVTDPAIGRAAPASRGTLIEGYVGGHAQRWEWRLGKQIIAWGRADAINPTDVVSPRDFTVLLPFDSDQREGAWAALGNYAWSAETTLSVLWKPDFQPSVIPIATGERASYQFRRPRHPAAQWGVRLNRAGGDLDWSVSVFRGHSLLPHAGPDQVPGTLNLSYPVITMVGADLARNFSVFGTRLEVAYVEPARRRRPDEPGLRRNVFLVAGVDRTFHPRLNINLQLFAKRSWDLPRDLAPGAAEAQDFNAATFLQQREWVQGLTLRISNAWLHDTLEAEVFVQRFLRGRDTFVQPMLTYAFSDAIRATLGAQYYSGSGLQFGPLRRNRGIFTELRYSF
jgi:hypothetical protein